MAAEPYQSFRKASKFKRLLHYPNVLLNAFLCEGSNIE